MVFTPEQAVRINAALAAKQPFQGCPLCGKVAGYTVFESPVLLGAMGSSYTGLPVAYYGCLALACNNCGNIQTLLLSTLGLGDLLQPPKPNEP